MPIHPTCAVTTADTMAIADSVAFAQLLQTHRGILLKVAASYARGAEDRADLAQEIALQLWRAFPSYARERPFSTWMYRVALNVAISQQRRERPLRAQESLDEAHHALVGDADVDAEERQRLELLQRAMQALGPLDLALLLLHLDGCSHRQCGEVLGLSESNAATRLSRIRQRLRQIDTH
jgi:RNA polymerase sigma-70 factor, ECF subfamily